jgi:hypothetical protein
LDIIDKLSAEAVANMAAKDRIGKASEAVRGSDYIKRLVEDEQLRESLLAASALKEASYAIRQPPAKAKRKGGLGRTLMLLVVGAILAIALSESLRSKVLDLLFGAEEEFDYSSTTMPRESPAAAGTPAA